MGKRVKILRETMKAAEDGCYFVEEKEVKQAMDAGLQVCTLGKRILRCETAPLCALSAVMYASGEF